MNLATALAVAVIVVTMVAIYRELRRHDRRVREIHAQHELRMREIDRAEIAAIRNGTRFDDELAMIRTPVLAAEPLPEQLAVFLPDPNSGVTKQEHRDGISWTEAPIPPRLHHCFVQTRGWLKLTQIERCACGAIRMDGGPWLRRNERKPVNR